MTNAASGISAPNIDIGIPEAQREAIATGLGRLLADSYVLYGKTHGFHWNVTGPMFNTLHLMFMDQYTELWASLRPTAVPPLPSSPRSRKPRESR